MADYNFASTSMLLRAYAVGDAFNGAVVIACLYICHDSPFFLLCLRGIPRFNVWLVDIHPKAE